MHLIRTHSAAWDICRMRLRISFPEALRHIPCSLFLLCAGWKSGEVAVVYFYAGADEKILDYLAETHEGIVIVGSGSGNYNRKWMKTMEKLAEKGTVFVRASRVSQGIVFDDRVF